MHEDPRYELAKDGSLRLLHGEDEILRIPADGTLAFLYDADGRKPDSMATLLAHGSAELVSARRSRMVEALSAGIISAEGVGTLEKIAAAFGRAIDPDVVVAGAKAALNDLETVEIPVAAVDDEILAETNACMAISGRIGFLVRRLSERKSGKNER
jgi:hypothetical protein